MNKSENVPGEFPFTAGLFPFKEGEDPTRMFAGEGGQKEQINVFIMSV